MEDIRKVAIHISHGGRLIIVANFIALLFAVPFFIHYDSIIVTAYHWIGFIADLIFTIFAFVGMKKNASKYLRPYLILSLIFALYTLLEFAIHHITISAKMREIGETLEEDYEYNIYNKQAQRISIIYALEIVLWLFDVFCIYICYKYYRYLQDIERYYAKIKGDIEARY